jgi:hypothetical protein
VKKSGIQSILGRVIFGFIRTKTNRLILKFAGANMKILTAGKIYSGQKRSNNWKL